MKLLSLLALGCCCVAAVLSESPESNEQALRARASAQLERLAPYRRTPREQLPTEEQWQLLENAARDPGIEQISEQQAFEIYRILPEHLQRDVANKVGGNRAMIELLANPNYMAMMQDRIKRSGSKREAYNQDGYESPPEGYPPEEPYGGYAPEPYGEHYGGGYPQNSGSDSGGIIKGSSSLIGGIAKGIIGGLVSASGSASKGSSSISASSSQSSAQSSATSSGEQKKPEYGHGYSYGDKAFDVWDFKKAIISTLMQAIKAISGGVIALKGQLLKGSGYLVSTKGKIMTKTGDAITSLGRNIAKSAAYPQHHHQPPHSGYSYEHPPEGHEESYDGPPPSIEEYGEPNEEYHGSSNYESPSDVDDQAGLLIVKPTKPDDHDHHTVDLDAEKPPLTQLEHNYHGPSPHLPHKEVENTVVANEYQNYNQGDHAIESSHPPDRPPSSYDVPVQQYSLNDYKGHQYPTYPPLASGSPLNLHAPFSIQQSVEYPPLHVQYALPNKGNFDLPHSDTSSNDLSVYSSLSIGIDPEIESIKISTLKPGGGIETTKLQQHANIHNNVPLLPNSYASLQEPLKIPLLTPYTTPYWPNQGLLQPLTTFDMHGLYRRRSSAQRRRSISQVAQRMRLHRG